MAGVALSSLGEIEHVAPNNPAGADPDMRHHAPVAALPAGL